MTIMGIVAQRHGLDLTGSTVRVTKEMTSAPPRRIARLAVDITVPQRVSEDDRRRLENAVHTCPAHRSLHPDIETPITFHWAD
jgi:putative redox protein